MHGLWIKHVSVAGRCRWAHICAYKFCITNRCT